MVGLKQATPRQYDLKLIWDKSRAEATCFFGRKPCIDGLSFCVCRNSLISVGYLQPLAKAVPETLLLLKQQCAGTSQDATAKKQGEHWGKHRAKSE